MSLRAIHKLAAPAIRTAIILMLLISAQLTAQGITRHSGFGFRFGFWNTGNGNSIVEVDAGGNGESVKIRGAGFWINHFSRVYDNWYWEFNAGTVGDVEVKGTSGIDETVDADAVIPLLVGLRYDMLATRLPGKLQPYFSTGFGPYWQSIANVREITADSSLVTTSSTMDLGGYAGGGLHFVFNDRIAMNFDLKYHLIDFSNSHPKSGLDFGMGLTFMWGKQRELFEVRGTRVIVKDIYPAYYRFYNTYPIAFVTVRNTAGYPIEVNVSCVMNPYSTQATESGFLRLGTGEIKDVPITVVFDPEIANASTRRPATLEISIEGRARSQLTRHISEQLTIHTRNSWDGEVDKLGFFMTPDLPEIVALSRSMVIAGDTLESPGPGKFRQARSLFGALEQRQIRYQSDPTVPYYADDRVQFAEETLVLKAGDCDDLVVLYATLLESLGIETVFVQVRDPQENLAHLYLLFDSGVAVGDAALISTNEKRYVIRENSRGEMKVWVPIETTVIDKGFENAWRVGATAYLEQGVLRNGLAEGWVKLVSIR